MIPKEKPKRKYAPKNETTAERRVRDVGRLRKGGILQGRSREAYLADLKEGVPVLDEELIDSLCEVVARGNFRYTARQAVGLTSGQFTRWVGEGNKHLKKMRADPSLLHTLQSTLCLRLDVAEGKMHADILEDVLSSKDPKVMLEFLKRRFNKQYSNNPNAHVDDETGKTEKIDVHALLADKLRALVE